MRRNINFVAKCYQKQFSGNTYFQLFFLCAQTQTLTKPSFRAGNMYSALSSMILSSLLGTDSTIFCTFNESSSHMMPGVFLSQPVAENKHGG